MSPLPSSDSRLSENFSSATPAASFDSQVAKAGLKKFAALWPLMPPVALFGIAFAFIGEPLPTPVGSRESAASTSVISASEWVVPASETMVVVKQAAAGTALLSGRLRAPQGEIVTATSRGQVARVMARVGQSVRAGDPLVLISRGTMDAPRSISPLERWQSQAESAQIAAARQQEKLESRMSGANERLLEAQQRVATAQTRVAAARALIARLQNGEEVGRSEVGQADAVKTEIIAPARRPDSSNLNAKRAEAARESRQLQNIADAAEAKAKAANKEAKQADGTVGEKQSRLKTAVAALAAAKSVIKSAPAKAPAESEAGDIAVAPSPPRASTPDTAAETKAVAAARDALAAASSRASQLHREAAKLQSRAAQLRANANDAARRAMQSLQVFEEESAASKAPSQIARESAPREAAPAGGDKVTIADAARIARQAMKESEDAIADADRIRSEIKSYARPVSGTRRSFDNATERLQAAQQQIWNSAGASPPSLTSVGAASGGVVLWVANVTREVKFGEGIAGIGRPDRLEVNVQDASGAWKSLAVGARVLALVKNGAPNSNLASSNLQTPGNAAPSPRPAINPTGGSTPAVNGTPTLARVVAIAPPVKAGAPATIRIAVHNPPQSGRTNQNGNSPRAFAPGMGVLFSLARPGKRVMIRVPAASIRRDENGKTLVAVLSPLPDAGGDQPASACRVEWREVRVGTGDGFNNQILTGLQPGERVALRPDTLYNFTLAYGTEATVRVEQT